MSLPPNRVDYLPMIDRPIIKWPDNARVAFWVAPNIEHYEYLPLLDGIRNPWPSASPQKFLCNGGSRDILGR
jgi:allantoinase